MTGTESLGACAACGSALAPGAPFCGTCGANVPPTERAAVVAAARAAAQGTAAAAAVAAAIPVPAAPGRRVAALVVDQLVAAAVMAAAYLPVVAGANSALASGSDAATIAALVGLLVVPIAASAVVGLAQLFAEGRSGATVGNAALGIRTVAVATWRPPGFGRAFLRRLIESLGSVVLVGSYVIAASSAWDRGRSRQGWQDKAAGTTMVTAASLGRRATGTRTATPASGIAAGPAQRPARSAAEGAGAGVAWPPVTTPSTDPALAAPRPTRLISDVPGFAPGEASDGAPVEPVPALASAPALASPPVAPAAPPGPASAASVRAPEPSSGDAFDRTRLAAPKPLHAAAYRLAFDTGETLVVTGPGLVGRNPAPGPGEVADHVIPIADPDRSVSKTHLAFGVGPEGFWVLDRGSMNGTAVTVGGTRTEVTLGTRVVVPVGGTVEFGDRSFAVSPA